MASPATVNAKARLPKESRISLEVAPRAIRTPIYPGHPVRRLDRHEAVCEARHPGGERSSLTRWLP